MKKFLFEIKYNFPFIKRLTKTVMLVAFFFSLSAMAQTNRLIGNKQNISRSSLQRVWAGSSYTFELRGDTIWGWGLNTYGQLGDSTTNDAVVPKMMKHSFKWKQIEPGINHVLGLKSDGTLWAWGNNNTGQLGIGNTTNMSYPVQVGSANSWISIACGGSSSYAIKSDGTLWAWGLNSNGQLGDASTSNRNAPVQVGTSRDWVTVSGGAAHTFGIKSDGSLWAWGNNGYGQLGDGTKTGKTSPVKIGSSYTWVSVAGGLYHSLGLMADGTLWAWGSNLYGQLGDGGTVDKTSPEQITNGTNWILIATGDQSQFSMAIKSDGTLWSWGENLYGRLGNGSQTNKSSPVKVGNGNNWVCVSPGLDHSVGQTSDGALFAWGNNIIFQNGNSSATYDLFPVKGNVIRNRWKSLNPGAFHTTGISVNGLLWVWGRNDSGQLGNNNSIDLALPSRINSNIDWLNLSAGLNHSVALKSNGTLWSWGANGNGQLGIGAYNSTNTPVQIDTNKTWVSVSAGGNHSIGIRSNGNLWGWGANDKGQLGDGSTTNYNAPKLIDAVNSWVTIVCGTSHTLGLHPDGTLWAWGDNTYGQLGIGSNSGKTLPTQVGSGNNWIAISAGNAFSIGLKSDGTLWAWGYNNKGQLGDSTTSDKNSPVQIGSATDWISIASGDAHSFALKSDGTIWSWGANAVGQLGDGTTNDKSSPVKISGSEWISISAKGNSSSGIKVFRQQYCMSGSNNHGQLGDGSNNDNNNITCIKYPLVTPEIGVKGNNYALPDGNKTYLSADGTDYGSLFVTSTKTNLFKIFNSGTDTLRITSMNTSGTSGSKFLVQGFKYPIKICSGDSLEFSVAFKPGTTGLKTGTLNILSNDLDEATYDFALKGIGVAPEIDIFGNNNPVNDGDSVASKLNNTDFGYIIPHTSSVKLFSVLNSGSDTLKINDIKITGINLSEFILQQLNFPLSILPGDSLQLKVTFTPNSKGVKKATLNILNNDVNESIYDFLIQGNGSVPEILVKGKYLTIPDGKTMSSLSDNTAFGNVLKKAKKTNIFKVFNPGTEVLNINNIYTGGNHAAEFSTPGYTYPMKINPGDSLIIPVVFNPADTGARSATLFIGNNDSSHLTYDFSLQGNGVMPVIEVWGNHRLIADGKLSPSFNDSTDFGSLLTGEKSVKTFVIRNNGSDSLTLWQLSFTGANSSDFSSPNIILPKILIPGDSMLLPIELHPNGKGIRKGIVNLINDDSSRLTYDFVIQGTVIAPKINVKGNNVSIANGDLTPSTLDSTDFGNVVAHKISLHTFTIQNTGTSALKITSIQKGGPDTSLFTIGNILLPLNVPVNGNATFTVTFAPLNSGPKNALIQIFSNDPDAALFDFAIQGTADPNSRLIKLSDDQSAIVVYPVPANNVLNISGLDEASVTEIKLFSPDGKLIFSKRSEKRGVDSFDVTDLADGVYMLSIDENGKRVSRKIVIQH